MELRKAILVCIRAAGESSRRTVLQKVLYLATLRGLTKAAFEPHYYGPYSSEVASVLQDLVSSGLVEEQSEVWATVAGPWEARRYRYSLPGEVETYLDTSLTMAERGEAAMLNRLVATCRDRGSLNPKALSIATKVLFTVNEAARPLTDSQIAKKASELGWEITDEEIQNSVVGLLRDLQLVQRN